MNRSTHLERLVRDLYESKNLKRGDWADWLYENHVIWVADKAEEIAQAYGVNVEYARVAALLHDIADAEMSRFEPNHEVRSLEIARDLLQKSGFNTEEIELIVNDAIKYHSCNDNQMPSSEEGQVLATADAIAHFQTDFFIHAFADASLNEYAKRKQWALKKIEKDFHKKLFFKEIKEEVRPQYETLKLLFSQ